MCLQCSVNEATVRGALEEGARGNVAGVRSANNPDCVLCMECLKKHGLSRLDMRPVYSNEAAELTCMQCGRKLSETVPVDPRTTLGLLAGMGVC